MEVASWARIEAAGSCSTLDWPESSRSVVVEPFDFVDISREPALGAVLIIGVPGAGKTTVARGVADRLDRSAHIEADAIHAMIASGRRDPDPAGDQEADRQMLVQVRNAGVLADSFASNGFTPVLDDVVVRRWHIEHWYRSICTRPLHVLEHPVLLGLGHVAELGLV